jgi:hypothetical protein
MKALHAICLMCLLSASFGLTALAQAEAKPAEAAAPPAAEAPREQPLTVAVLGFSVGNTLPEDMGQNLSSLLVAYLSAQTDAKLVEREQVDKALSEVGLAMSGMASTEDAVKVGHLVGAKVLITGRAFSLNKEDLTIVAKIIGTETGRVFGLVAKSKTPEDLDATVADLAAQVGEKLKANAKLLVAPTAQETARATRINEALGKLARPSMLVIVGEQHMTRLVIDPAAETELSLYLTQCGFKVLDKEAKLKKGWFAQLKGTDPKEKIPPELIDEVQVVLIGEAFSELGLRKGELYSCKARVELKAIDTATGEVLAVDRETDAGVDVAESTAAKTAIQKASATLAERIIPALAAKWNAAHREGK